MLTRRFLMLAPVAVLLAACAAQAPSTPATVAGTIARTSNLSTLNSLVAKAGLADTLDATGPYTLFAPTNEAFAAVPAKTMDELGKDPARLKAVLSYHLIAGKVTAAQVKNGEAKTVQGANVMLSRTGDFVVIEDAMVQTADLQATNGVVHTIDRVLMPPAKH